MAPAASARSTKPATRSSWRGWISGPTRTPRWRGSPTANALRGFEHARAELGFDRGLDQHARAGQAHLARVVELRGDARRGVVEIGVGEHDERRLAAELEADRRDVRRRGRAPTSAAGRGRAGEADAIDAGVLDQRLARFGAEALHDVEHAGRHARARRDLARAASTKAAPTPAV